MKIRRAEVTRGDYEIFKKMHLSFQYAEVNETEERARNAVIKNYEDYYMYADNEWIYFAVKDCNVIGYVVITAYDDLTVKLEELYIAKEFQRKGNGKKFVKKIIRFLKECGMPIKKLEVFSATMATDNFWAECKFRSVNGSEMFEYVMK